MILLRKIRGDDESNIESLQAMWTFGQGTPHVCVSVLFSVKWVIEICRVVIRIKDNFRVPARMNGITIGISYNCHLHTWYLSKITRDSNEPVCYSGSNSLYRSG